MQNAQEDLDLLISKLDPDFALSEAGQGVLKRFKDNLEVLMNTCVITQTTSHMTATLCESVIRAVKQVRKQAVVARQDEIVLSLDYTMRLVGEQAKENALTMRVLQAKLAGQDIEVQAAREEIDAKLDEAEKHYADTVNRAEELLTKQRATADAVIEAVKASKPPKNPDLN